MTLIIKQTGIEDFLSGGEAHIKCLILGPPSAGKTRSASFWPDPIYADCEKGRMSIADRHVPYAEIGSIQDMDALLHMLALECRKPTHQRKYKTLVLDCIDSYQRIVIAYRLNEQKKEALSGWGDYGWLDSKMTQLVSRLMALPMNIVVNCHTKVTTVGDDDSKMEVVVPKLKGDYKDQIAADFDLVGYMGTFWEAENGERVLKRGIQWWPEPGKPFIKDRSGTLPKWTDVTFTETDYLGLLVAMGSAIDDMAEGEVLETLETDPQVTVAPVGPLPGGPVQGQEMLPKPTPRKTAAKAPAKKAEPTPAAPPAAASARSSAATDVVVQPEQASSGPGQAEQQIAGADHEPEQQPAAEATPPAEDDAEARASEAEAVAAVQDALGGTVISDEPTADAPASQEAQVQEQASSQDWPVCGTSSDEDMVGQPGSVAGCGKPVDPDDDSTQIAIFKTRTYLCPADFAAWRAANKK